LTRSANDPPHFAGTISTSLDDAGGATGRMEFMTS
jgi:hypothetical protein